MRHAATFLPVLCTCCLVGGCLGDQAGETGPSADDAASAAESRASLAESGETTPALDKTGSQDDPDRGTEPAETNEPVEEASGETQTQTGTDEGTAATDQPSPTAEELAARQAELAATITTLESRLEDAVANHDYNEAYRLAAELASTHTDPERISHYHNELARFRQLKRDAGAVRRALAKLGADNQLERETARNRLLSIGQVVPPLLRSELPQSTGIKEVEIVGILSSYRDTTSLPMITEIFRRTDQPDRRALIGASLADLIGHADAAALQPLLEQIDNDTAGEHRALATLLVTADRENGLSSDASDTLKAYIERLGESGEDELVAWARQYAGYAGLRKPGLRGTYWNNTDFEGEPATTRIEGPISFDKGEFAAKQDNIAVRWQGFLEIPAAGEWTLTITSDDGSRLWLDGEQRIDNWGYHGMEDKSATLDLEAGYHELRIDYIQGGGGAGMILRWQGPGVSKRQVVPESALWHTP